MDACAPGQNSTSTGGQNSTRINNVFAIRHINAGKNVWTEREIQAKLAPIKTVNRKIPDVLVNTTDPTYQGEMTQLAWVEIENSYKKHADYLKMLRFIFNVLGALDSQGNPITDLFCAAPDVYISEVIIQIPTEEQLRRLVTTVSKMKTEAPYDYGWGYILDNFRIASHYDATSVPLSRWIDY